MAFFQNDRIKTFPMSTVLIGTWVAFTSFYTLLSFAYPFIASKAIESARQAGYVQGANDATTQALQSFSGNVFQNGQQSGQQAMVMKLVDELGKQFQEGCQNAVPVTVGTGSIGILSANCLQVINSGSGTQTSQETPAPVKK